MKLPTNWSYSRLKTYEQCPFKFRALHGGEYQISQEMTPALERGNRLHSVLEDYVRGREPILDPMFTRFGDYINAVREHPVKEVESEWSMDRHWVRTARWSNPSTWWRGKLDVFMQEGDKARVIDWKTGKIYPDNIDQVRLYAGVVLHRLPEIKEVRVELIYLDQYESREAIYEAKDKGALRSDFDRRVATMMSDTTWVKKPGPLCKWCPANKINGGPCDAGA
jgi:CRISPR/Cas system-associated exonuclease Cas4 (RecB family)